MSVVGSIHEKHVFGRRIRVLSKHLIEVLPKNAKVLDVGCGDGSLGNLIMNQRPDLELRGIDVLVREKTAIPVTTFDGEVIPFDDDAFDVVMFVDVLHHTDDPAVLLREADRVASQAVVIKDHLKNGFLAGPTLRFMDWVGNAHHGVVLPYNYWRLNQWQTAFEQLHWRRDEWRVNLGLYPWPASWLFGRGLHFIGRFNVKGSHE